MMQIVLIVLPNSALYIEGILYSMMTLLVDYLSNTSKTREYGYAHNSHLSQLMLKFHNNPY